jgi:hypothetical protein
MTPEWAETLTEVYRDCRNLPRWCDLVELHDQEDREFFALLDISGGRHGQNVSETH